MTISSSTASASYTGNGTTTAFTIPFYFLVDTDVKISQKSGATGAITVLTLNSDYTLTGAGNQAGGTATLTVAPLGGTTPDQLFIERNVDAVQETAYPVNSPFPAASHEKALDRLTMLVQQILSKLTFGLFRNPLAATYDLGSNTLSNIANAVNPQDVPSFSQVQQLVTGAASGIPPSNIALVSDLASTAAGKGAALVGYKSSATGALPTDVNASLQGVVRLKADFKAKGDGVTDDGAALAAFLAAAAGRIGELEPGTYLSNRALALPSNCVIRGAGMDVTTIVQGAALPTGASFIVMGLSNCVVANLTIDGNYPGNTGFLGASLQALPNSTVNAVVNVKFKNWAFQALSLYGDTVVDGCVFSGSSTTAIKPAQYGIWYDNAAARVSVSNCNFSGIATNAIIAGGVSSITGCVFKGHGSYSGTQSGAIYTDHTTVSCAIHGNIIQADGGHGLGVESNYGANVITGNYVTSQTAGGITLEGTGSHLVTGNTCTGCYDGVDIKAGASNFVVSGNNLFANTHAQINVEAGSSNNFVIDGNRLNGTTALIDNSTGTTKTITNNLGFNPVPISGITVGASPFSYTNNLGYPIVVGIENGSVSQVAIGGYTAGGYTNSQYLLPHGKTITVTYSSAPSMLYFGV